MAITIHNYEVFFIDYHEGNLSQKETEALMVFLDAHPDLKAEFEEFHPEQLSPDLSITYHNKGSLKRKAEASSMELEDELLIGYLEGDLTEKKSLEVRSIIAKDMRIGRLYQQYQSAKLTADPNIGFPGKAGLKKKTGIIFLYPQTLKYAAAAMIIMMLGLSAYFVFTTGNVIEPTRYDLARLENRSATIITTNKLTDAPVMRERSVAQVQINHREKIVAVKMIALNARGIEAGASEMLAAKQLATRSYVSLPSFHESRPSEALAVNEVPRQKSFARKIISGLFSNIKNPFSTNQSDQEAGDQESRSVWNIADLGMKGVNALGDHEYTLIREYNEKGNVKGFRIVGE